LLCPFIFSPSHYNNINYLPESQNAAFIINTLEILINLF